MTVTYLYTFTAGQYFELWGLADVNNMTIKATAAGAAEPGFSLDHRDGKSG